MRESTALIIQALYEKGYSKVQQVILDPFVLTWSQSQIGTHHTCILQEYADDHGCELFIQADTTNSTEKTIAAIP